MPIPVAQAGVDQSFAYSASAVTVTLAGAATNTPITSWKWTMLSVPSGSGAATGANQDFTAGEATIQNPQFDMDIPGCYVLQLEAENASGWSIPVSDKAGGQTLCFMRSEDFDNDYPGYQAYRYDSYLLATIQALESALADHSARHETGGPDEISVASLTGLLGTDQNAVAIRETDGPTLLTAGAILDGQLFARVGATLVGQTKRNLAASVAPTANDDSTADYSVGSLWIDTTGNKGYLCLDATAAAAVWFDITQTGGGGGGGFDHEKVFPATVNGQETFNLVDTVATNANTPAGYSIRVFVNGNRHEFNSPPGTREFDVPSATQVRVGGLTIGDSVQVDYGV